MTASDINKIKTLTELQVKKYSKMGHFNPLQAADYAIKDITSMFKFQPQYIGQLLDEEIEDIRKIINSI